jgi:hypothetical protein
MMYTAEHRYKCSEKSLQSDKIISPEIIKEFIALKLYHKYQVVTPRIEIEKR